MRVIEVRRGGVGERLGVRAGDELLAVAGQPTGDSLDLDFALGFSDEDTVPCELARGGGRVRISLPRRHPGDLGVELAPDRYRSCGNRCVFCFVDQLPPGLRRSLYVKDEDYRLSFSFGNYVTLTNLTDADYARVAAQRLSPLYVSVHASDDSVRRRMLGNDGAPPILASLARLRDAGVRVHTQVVVCPGMNDGPVLERTLTDLIALGEVVQSIAVVPVGLTAHRAGLPRVEPVTAPLARAIVGDVEERQTAVRGSRGSAVVFASDELYLLAGIELPPTEAYEDFPQLENGVGLLRHFEADLTARAPELEGTVSAPLALTMLTAPLAAPFLTATVGSALAAVAPIETRVVAVENTLLGPTVTVAGLLPGRDMARALRAAGAADLFLLPGEAFNEDGLTIDGLTADAIARQAGKEPVAASRDVVSPLVERAAAGPPGGVA